MAETDIENICYYCNEKIIEDSYNFPCGHKYCQHCLSLTLIHSEFALLTHENIEFFCICGNKEGKIEKKLEEYMKIIEKIKENEYCKEHKEEKLRKYCNTCNIEICEKCINEKHKGHEIEKEKKKIRICKQHNEELVMYCKECNKEYCKSCLIEKPETHNHIDIEKYRINYSEKIRKNLNVGNKKDLQKIIENKKNEYINSLKIQYDENIKNIKTLINTLQKLLDTLDCNFKDNNNYAENIKKIIYFSYDNFFYDLDNPISISIDILKKFEKINKEIKFVEFKQMSYPIFEKFLFKIQNFKEKKVNKINIKFSDLKKDQDSNIFSFPSNHSDFLSCFNQHSDDVYISGSLDNNIHIYEYNKSDNKFIVQKKLEGHETCINCIIPTDDGKIISASIDGDIKIWNSITGDFIKSIHQENLCRVNCLLYIPIKSSSNYNKLLSCDESGNINIWRLDTYDLIENIEGDKDIENDSVIPINCIGEIYNYNIIYTGDENGRLTIYDENIKKVKTFDNKIEKSIYISPIKSMLSLNDFKIAIGKENGSISIVNPESEFGEEFCLNEHKNWVTSLAQVKSNNLLLSGSRDENVKIWDLSTKTLIKNLEFDNTIIGIYVTEDKRVIVGCADNYIKIWKL